MVARLSSKKRNISKDYSFDRIRDWIVHYWYSHSFYRISERIVEHRDKVLRICSKTNKKLKGQRLACSDTFGDGTSAFGQKYFSNKHGICSLFVSWLHALLCWLCPACN